MEEFCGLSWEMSPTFVYDVKKLTWVLFSVVVFNFDFFTNSRATATHLQFVLCPGLRAMVRCSYGGSLPSHTGSIFRIYLSTELKKMFRINNDDDDDVVTVSSKMNVLLLSLINFSEVMRLCLDFWVCYFQKCGFSANVFLRTCLSLLFMPSPPPPPPDEKRDCVVWWANCLVDFIRGDDCRRKDPMYQFLISTEECFSSVLISNNFWGIGFIWSVGEGLVCFVIQGHDVAIAAVTG